MQLVLGAVLLGAGAALQDKEVGLDGSARESGNRESLEQGGGLLEVMITR